LPTQKRWAITNCNQCKAKKRQYHNVMPLPDQDAIRKDVAWAKYRSKIDLADMYEQVRVEPNDV
jgi:hypothetical protein